MVLTHPRIGADLRPSTRPGAGTGTVALDNRRVRSGLHTPLCDLLDVRYPILNAGIGWAAGPELAAAVSNAGGFGVLGGGERAEYDCDEQFAHEQVPLCVERPLYRNLQ